MGLRCRFHEKAARVTRAAAPKPRGLQAVSDSDENDPDKLADVAVVAIFKVAITVANGPAALLLNEINAMPL